MSDLITVALACNNDRGNFAGCAGSFDFDCDGDWQVVVSGDDLTVNFDGDWMLVAGESFPVTGRERWVGNMAWDSIRMSLSQARRLLAHLFDRGLQAEMWMTSGPLADIVEAHR